MFTYYFRILDRFGQPPVSLAILCDSNARWRPTTYEFEQLGTRLWFGFNTVKLLDYQADWARLEASENPFATVTMAHLKMLETHQQSQQRKEWKFGLMRRLYERGWQAQDIRNLYRFIDWIMILPKALEAEFWIELKQYEESQRMPYITSGARIEYERGQQEGRQEGWQEADRRNIEALLEAKFGELDSELAELIPAMMQLTTTDRTRLILQSSRETLIGHFSQAS
jgi:hypothetical protein